MPIETPGDAIQKPNRRASCTKRIFAQPAQDVQNENTCTGSPSVIEVPRIRRDGARYCSLSEAAEMIGRDRRAVREDVESGRLTAERHRQGSRAMYRILLADLAAFYGLALPEESHDGATGKAKALA
jgi:hypothetical protein